MTIKSVHSRGTQTNAAPTDIVPAEPAPLILDVEAPVHSLAPMQIHKTVEQAPVVEVDPTTVAEFTSFLGELGGKPKAKEAAPFLTTSLDLDAVVPDRDVLVELTPVNVEEIQIASTIEGERVERNVATWTQPAQVAFTGLVASMRPAFVEQVARAAFAGRVLGPITLPKPSLIENCSVDVDTLAQLVMMACAKDSEADLRDLLSEMQVTGKKRNAMRSQIAEQKRQRAALSESLRRRYDERCALDATDPDAIDRAITSFEAYCDTQPVVDGAISPNYVRYPKALPQAYEANGNSIPVALIDLAEKLGITPQNAALLNEKFIDDPRLLTIYGSLAMWLIAGRELGGVGLSFPADTQDVAVAQFLLVSDPKFKANTLCSQYNLLPATFEKMQSLWDEQGPTFQSSYANNIELWLAAPPPHGPGLVGSSATRQDGKCSDAFVASFRTELQSQELIASTGITRDRLWAVESYRARFAPEATLEGFLSDICGENTDRNGAVDWFFTSRMDPKQVDPYKSDYAGYLEAHEVWEQKALPYQNALAKKRAADGASDIAASISHLYDEAKNAGNFMVDLPAVLSSIKDYGTQLGEVQRAQVLHLVQAIHAATMKVALCKNYGADHTRSADDARVLKESEAEFAAADDALNAYVDSQSPAGLARNYACLLLGLGAAVESYMQYNEWEYDRGAAAVVGFFGQNCNKDGVLAGFNHFHITVYQNGKPVQGNPYMGSGEHKWGSWHLKDRWLGQSVNVAIELPEDPGPMPLAPDIASDKYKGARDIADQAHNCGRDKAPVVAERPRTDPPTLDQLMGDATRAQNAKRVAAPKDRSIAQPTHTDVGKELNLAGVDAFIEKLQGDCDGLGDLTQQQSARLQLYQDRRQKFYETLSAIMKRAADTANNVLGNLK